MFLLFINYLKTKLGGKKEYKIKLTSVASILLRHFSIDHFGTLTFGSVSARKPCGLVLINENVF